MLSPQYDKLIAANERIKALMEVRRQLRAEESKPIDEQSPTIIAALQVKIQFMKMALNTFY